MRLVSFPPIPDTTGEFLLVGRGYIPGVADYLETDSAIDKTKLIITGASRAYGKSAMVAAAFDERLTGAQS